MAKKTSKKPPTKLLGGKNLFLCAYPMDVCTDFNDVRVLAVIGREIKKDIQDGVVEGLEQELNYNGVKVHLTGTKVKKAIPGLWVWECTPEYVDQCWLYGNGKWRRPKPEDRWPKSLGLGW